MKIYDNGTLRDMTDEEVKEHEEFFKSIPDDEPEVTIDDVVEALDILTSIVLGEE